MSLENKKFLELKKIAKICGIDVSNAKTKKDILSILDINGITEEVYLQIIDQIDGGNQLNESAKITVQDHTKSEVVLTMTHPFATYLVRGVLFTKDEPFKVVDRKTADEILSHPSTRIREAKPEEVAAFYSG